MTLEQAMEKIKALWPQHDVMNTPIGAKGVLQILQELGLIKFGNNEFEYDAEKAKEVLAPKPEIIPENKPPVTKKKKETINEG